MGWLNSMALRSKLLLLSGVLLLGLIVVGVIGVSGVMSWAADVAEIGVKRFAMTNTISTLDYERRNLAAQTYSVYQYENYEPDQANEVLTKLLAERKESYGYIDRDWANLTKYYEQGFFTAPESLQILKELPAVYKQWRDLYVAIDSVIEAVIKNSDPDKQPALFEAYKKNVVAAAAVSADIQVKIEQIRDLNSIAVDSVVKNALAASSQQERLIIGLLAAVLVISIVLMILIIRSITKSISEGVLTISDANAQVLSASNQIASSAISLAEGASTQASSVEEVSATVEQSTAVNTQNSENAHEASILAQGANEAAGKGNEKVKRLMVSMVEITDASEQIAKIIKAIDEIAFQTNLLALNAAVEAARAGEHGLGFAVVADEVKNLAGRSANAAKETSGIIEKAIGKIKEGNQIAKETNEAFAEILDKAKKTSDLIGEIASSVKEQADGMNQIATAMGQIDSITQQNAATSEQAAAASEQMSAQANSMMDSVAELGRIVGLTIDVTKAAEAAPAPAQKARQATPQVKRPAPAKALLQRPTVPQRPKKREEEIFPLEASDMKEF